MPSRRVGARTDKANLRTRLAELRDASGARQLDMAEAMGLSLNTYRKLEAGGYDGEEPIGMMVNAAMVLGIDPLVLIEPHLTWRTFRLDRTSPPAVESVAPGVPPRPPVPDSPAVEERLALSARARELLRRLVDLDARLDGAVFSWERERDSEMATITAEPVAGRRRGQRRPDPVFVEVEQIEELLEAGALTSERYRLSAAAHAHAARAFRS